VSNQHTPMSELPKAVAKLAAPPKVIAAQRYIWRFAAGPEYAITLPEGAIEETPEGWAITTPEGRAVTVYRRHVLTVERLATTMKVKATDVSSEPNAAQAEAA
jgi:hypothetical protein